MRRLAVIAAGCAALIVGARAAASDEGLESLSQRLTQVRAVSGNFDQERRIAVLSKPIISRGRFVFSFDRGLVWAVERPYSGTVFIGAEGRFEQRLNGKPQALAGRSQEVVKGFTSVVVSLFRGDLAALKNHFDLSYQPGDPWRVRFIPHDRILRQFISLMTLEGRELVERMHIEESNGDSTDVRFLDQRVLSSLSSDELNLFSPFEP